MNDINIDQLILEISSFPEIWDHSSTNYKNRNKKKNAWTMICKKIFPEFETKSKADQQVLIDCVMQKWKCIRDAYKRSLRNMKSKKSESGRTKKSYVYADSLSFLDETRTLRETDLSDVAFDNPEENSEEVVDDPLAPTRNVSVPSASTEKRRAIEKISYTPVKKSKLVRLERDISDYLGVVKTHQNNTLRPEDENDDLTFFKSLLPLLKGMDANEKITFRMDVMGLVHSALQKRDIRLEKIKRIKDR